MNSTHSFVADYNARQDPTAPNNLIAMRGDSHAKRRRLWNRGMNSESLKEYEQLIDRRAQQLVERLEASSGPVDLAAWLGYFSFDFMGSMAFGGGFEMLRDGGDKQGLWAVIDNFVMSVFYSNLLYFADVFSLFLVRHL